MKLTEAAVKGICRVRLPQWADADTYLKIDLIDGGIGPWGHLYSPHTQKAIHAPTPQDLLIIGDTDDEYEEYKGEICAEEKP